MRVLDDIFNCGGERVDAQLDVSSVKQWHVVVEMSYGGIERNWIGRRVVGENHVAYHLLNGGVILVGLVVGETTDDEPCEIVENASHA